MHPLFENTQDLSDNELEEKILLLNRRYFQTQNLQVQQQIISLLDDYKLELESRRAKNKVRQEQQSQDENGKNDLDNLINIS